MFTSLQTLIIDRQASENTLACQADLFGRQPMHAQACVENVFPCCAEPEVRSYTLTAEDEFLVLACDGLWDVMSSQRCMELARTQLRDNNDPQLCAEYLVGSLSLAPLLGIQIG